MTDKPYTDADVEQLAAMVRARIGWPISAGEAGTIVTVVLQELAVVGRLTPADDDPRHMTDQDRCTDTNPHPAHRTQYGSFGLKDCPGVPMTSREELRAERVTTGRLEGNLRSQTRAVRELTAERDALRAQLDAMKAAKKRVLGRLEKAEHVIDLIRDGQEQIDRALATYDTTPGSADLGSPAPRAQDEPDSDARRLLDQAVESALPLAGGRVRKLLKALRRELVNVDAKRAERAG